MEKTHIQMSILKQEQTFRQQVHEMHRLYQVQKQLMTEMQVVEMNQPQARVNAQTKLMVESDHPGWFGNLGEKKAPFIEDFDLELTLATGGASRKQEVLANSDSGATVSSSTSAESDLARRFPESIVKLSIQNESKRHDDQLMQSPWLCQCLSLKMA